MVFGGKQNKLIEAINTSFVMKQKNEHSENLISLERQTGYKNVRQDLANG